MIRAFLRNSMVKSGTIGFLLIGLSLLPLLFNRQQFLASITRLSGIIRFGGAGPTTWTNGLAGYGLLLLFGVLFAVGIIWLGRTTYLVLFPSVHPIMRKLAHHGPPGEIAQQIDTELRDDQEVMQIGEGIRSFRLSREGHDPVLISRSWIVQMDNQNMNLHLVRLEDMVGLRRTQLPRPDGTVSHAVEVFCEDGHKEHFPVSEMNAPRLVLSILGRLPWVITHFNEHQWSLEKDSLLSSREQEKHQIQLLPPEQREQFIQEKARQA